MQLRKSGQGSRPRTAKRGVASQGWPVSGRCSVARAVDRIGVAVDAKDGALALQQIEDCVEQGLVVCTVQADPFGAGRNRVGFTAVCPLVKMKRSSPVFAVGPGNSPTRTSRR